MTTKLHISLSRLSNFVGTPRYTKSACPTPRCCLVSTVLMLLMCGHAFRHIIGIGLLTAVIPLSIAQWGVGPITFELLLDDFRSVTE